MNTEMIENLIAAISASSEQPLVVASLLEKKYVQLFRISHYAKRLTRDMGKIAEKKMNGELTSGKRKMLLSQLLNNSLRICKELDLQNEAIAKFSFSKKENKHSQFDWNFYDALVALGAIATVLTKNDTKEEPNLDEAAPHIVNYIGKLYGMADSLGLPPEDFSNITPIYLKHS